MYKTLPKASGSFKRVKVRHRNLAADNPYSFLAEKFGATFPKRTVDCSTTLPLVESTDRDLYYIFPTNGYKVVYSRHIDNLRDTCDSLTEAVLQTHMTVGIDWLEDVTRDAYEFSPSLKHAADGGDILVYNMSHFYAIRASDYNYSDILKFANKGLN